MFTTSHLDLDPSRIDAVVFDIGGVFTIRHWDPICNGMARGGFTIEPNPVTFHKAHYKAIRSLSDLLPSQPVNEYDKDFWSHFERGYLACLGIPEADLERATQTMFAEVFNKEPKPVWRYLLKENIKAFHRIASAGIPVAIVSNNDGTAEQQMNDFGICQVGAGPLTNVAAIVDSGVVGIAKPEPAIFAPALAALNLHADRVLYVGDTVHADVVGARAAGMPVVQLDPYDLHGDFDHARLPDVGSIADLLIR
jgi:putative hydrolase of the HAD superfamily